MAKQITQKLGFQAGGAMRNLGSLTKKLEEANAALRTFKDTAGGAAISGLGKVDKAVDKSSKKVNQFTVSWGTMVRVLQTQIIVRALGTLIQSLQEGIESAHELGLAIEEVQTISGRGQTSMALSNDILELSSAIGKAPKDLAEGLYQTLSNQVVEAGEALNFTSEAAKLATVTASDTKDAVNALSSVMNSYGMEASQAGKVSSSLFKTVELGRLRLGEIADVIGRVTPLTAAMGVSWNETAAAIAVMTRQGVRADTAITQLRAVMSKLIKPTKEMKELFHKWGVKDGKQAIKTFGGLRGVLKKMAKETGGSSEEMANLFRRVRAIVGQMSLMTDEGKLFADTMNEIASETNAAQDAWDIFAESDAQKLTRSIQEFKNVMLSLGVKLLPVLNKGMEKLNRLLENSVKTWKVLTGGISNAEKVVNTFKQKAKEAAKAIEKMRSDQGPTIAKQYEDALASADKYYASVNKQELLLMSIRDKAIERATQSYKDANKEIAKFFQDAVRDLENFIKDSSKRIENNAKQAAKIQNQIEDKILSNKLEGANNYYYKKDLLDKALMKAERKFADQMSKVDYTNKSKEAALAANERALEMVRKALQNARNDKTQDHTKDIRRYEKAEIHLMQQRKGVVEKNTEAIKKHRDEAKASLDDAKKNASEIEKAFKQLDDLLSSGDLYSSDEGVRKSAEALRDELKTKIIEAASDTKNGKALLKSLDLDNTYTKLTNGLTAAMNAAQKDWEAEVVRAQEAFNKKVIHIRAQIDAENVIKKTGQALGVNRVEGETEADYARRTNEAAINILQKRQDIETKVAESGVRNAKRREAVEASLKGVFADTNQRLSVLLNTEYQRQIALDRTQTKTEALDKAEKIWASKWRNNEYFGPMTKMQEKFRGFVEDLKEGKLVSTEVLQNTNTELGNLVKAGKIPVDMANGWAGILVELKKWSQENENINKTMKDMPNDEALIAAKNRLAETQKTADAEKRTADATNQQKDAAANVAQQMQNVKSAAQGAKEQIEGINSKMKDAANNATSVGVNSQASVGGISAAARTAAVLAANMERAAAASAQIGSGGRAATAFHGRFFAAGGRGMDKIPAFLSRGESVINSKNSARFFSEIHAMNQGSKPVFREQGGSVTNVGDVNVTVKGGDTSQQTVREIGRALRREIQRGTIKLS